MQQIRSALSLFNGISGLHLALDKAQINVEQVYYSEIDKFANKVTEQQYPNDIALGDVTKWKECLSNTQRYKSLGNGWTIDVIVHILECAFK